MRSHPVESNRRASASTSVRRSRSESGCGWGDRADGKTLRRTFDDVNYKKKTSGGF